MLKLFMLFLVFVCPTSFGDDKVYRDVFVFGDVKIHFIEKQYAGGAGKADCMIRTALGGKIISRKIYKRKSAVDGNAEFCRWSPKAVYKGFLVATKSNGSNSDFIFVGKNGKVGAFPRSDIYPLPGSPWLMVFETRESLGPTIEVFDLKRMKRVLGGRAINLQLKKRLKWDQIYHVYYKSKEKIVSFRSGSFPKTQVQIALPGGKLEIKPARLKGWMRLKSKDLRFPWKKIGVHTDEKWAKQEERSNFKGPRDCAEPVGKFAIADARNSEGKKKYRYKAKNIQIVNDVDLRAALDLNANQLLYSLEVHRHDGGLFIYDVVVYKKNCEKAAVRLGTL